MLETLTLPVPYAFAGEAHEVAAGKNGNLLFAWSERDLRYVPRPHVLTAGYGNRSVEQLVALGKALEVPRRRHPPASRVEPPGRGAVERKKPGGNAAMPVRAAARARQRKPPGAGEAH